MKKEQIIKSNFIGIAVSLCILFLGCSQEYIERTDAQLREYRKSGISPHHQVIKSDGYWWGGHWQSMPSFGCGAGSIHFSPSCAK